MSVHPKQATKYDIMVQQYSFLFVFPLLLLFVIIYRFKAEPDIQTHPPENRDTVSEYEFGYEYDVENFRSISGEEIPEPIRIQIHLDYVEQLLRNQLEGLSSDQQVLNQDRYLDLLKVFQTISEVPYKNIDNGEAYLGSCS